MNAYIDAPIYMRPYVTLVKRVTLVKPVSFVKRDRTDAYMVVSAS